jgi:hypothetical protein
VSGDQSLDTIDEFLHFTLSSALSNDPDFFDLALALALDFSFSLLLLDYHTPK